MTEGSTANGSFSFGPSAVLSVATRAGEVAFAGDAVAAGELPPLIEAPQKGQSVASSSSTDWPQEGQLGRSMNLVFLVGTGPRCSRRSGLPSE